MVFVALGSSVFTGGVVWGASRSEVDYLRKDHEKLSTRVEALEGRAAGYDVTMAEMKKDVAYIRQATDEIRSALVPRGSPAIQHR